jgi:uncharacterized protein YecE (DUF72 family)
MASAQANQPSHLLDALTGLAAATYSANAQNISLDMLKREDKKLAAKLPAKLRIGPAGWSYPDWNGYVYPKKKQKEFHEASFLAEFFDTIEINTSFYNPVKAEHAKQWIERVSANRNFVFTAKLWQRFTHEMSASKEDEKLVREGFEPLRDAAKLGAVLLQFPFSFHRTAETTAYLEALLKRFADFPLVVEVRHASWNVPGTFALLTEHNAGFCNIDQPLIGRSMKATEEATSPVGYVRLHGRRYDTWFSDDENLPSHERYNYLYSMEELKPWVMRIEKLQESANDVFVIANNHYQGKAVVNALQLISILKPAKVKVPEPILQNYPQLESIAQEGLREPTLFEMGKAAQEPEKKDK